jgi:hypothetical protein
MSGRLSRFAGGDRQAPYDSSFGQAFQVDDGSRRILTAVAITTFRKHRTMLVWDDYREGKLR